MKIKRRTLERIRLWSLRAAIVLLVGISFVTYIRSSFFTITTYTFRGVEESYQTILIKELRDIESKKRFLVIPGNKILTYNKRNMIEAVHRTVTDASTITFRTLGLHTVEITVTTLLPIVRTQDGQALAEDGTLFFTRKDLSSYPVFTVASSSVVKVKRNGLMVSKLMYNGEAISQQFLRDLIDMSSKVSSIVFPVQTIALDEGTDVALIDIRGVSKVLFLKDADMKKVWSTLVSAIDTEPLASKLEHEKDRLLYLDVRFGNKVFYKFSAQGFQNSSSTGIMTNHETSPSSSSTLPE